MYLKYKIVILSLILINLTTCNYTYHKRIYTKNEIYPYYYKQFDDMQAVNSKNVVVKSVVKDTLNIDHTINELAEKQISVLKLWATWCTPCIANMSEYVNLKDRYKSKKNIRFYTVSLDDRFSDWKKFINKNDWKVDHYWAGSNQKSQIYQLTYEAIDSMVLITLPHYLIINKNGKVLENNNANNKARLEEVIKKIAK